MRALQVLPFTFAMWFMAAADTWTLAVADALCEIGVRWSRVGERARRSLRIGPHCKELAVS